MQEEFDYCIMVACNHPVIMICYVGIYLCLLYLIYDNIDA